MCLKIRPLFVGSNRLVTSKRLNQLTWFLTNFNAIFILNTSVDSKFTWQKLKSLILLVKFSIRCLANPIWTICWIKLTAVLHQKTGIVKTEAASGLHVLQQQKQCSLSAIWAAVKRDGVSWAWGISSWCLECLLQQKNNGLSDTSMKHVYKWYYDVYAVNF